MFITCIFEVSATLLVIFEISLIAFLNVNYEIIKIIYENIKVKVIEKLNIY